MSKFLDVEHSAKIRGAPASTGGRCASTYCRLITREAPSDSAVATGKPAADMPNAVVTLSVGLVKRRVGRPKLIASA